MYPGQCHIFIKAVPGNTADQTDEHLICALAAIQLPLSLYALKFHSDLTLPWKPSIFLRGSSRKKSYHWNDAELQKIVDDSTEAACTDAEKLEIIAESKQRYMKV